MKILYIDWNENSGKDCCDSLSLLGYEVQILPYTWKNLRTDEVFEKEIAEELSRKQTEIGCNYFAAIFSFDFFPVVARVCEKVRIPYISYVYDSPHMTLFAEEVKCVYNHIYVFDKALVTYFNGRGMDKIRYCPLSVNRKRMEAYLLPGNTKQIESSFFQVDIKQIESPLQPENTQKIDLSRFTGNEQKSESGFLAKSTQNANEHRHTVDEFVIAQGLNYTHEVSFIGSLYDNQYTLYDQISYLPPYVKGRFDAVIEAQQQVFGYDMAGDEAVIDASLLKEAEQYVKASLGEGYLEEPGYILRDILRRKITQQERWNILRMLGEKFSLDLYTDPKSKAPDSVHNMGYAGYYDKMPQVFHESKINLNITLRSILTGIPLRALDIMAAGGFLLSNYQKELAESFLDGEELVLCMTPEEFAEKTLYYLEHDKERCEIAENGQQKVLRDFGYEKNLKRMLEESL